MAVVNAIKPDFLTELLVCPHCKSDLKMDNNYLRCTHCTEQYSILDHVPEFIRYTEINFDQSDPITRRKNYEQRFFALKNAIDYRNSFTTIRRNIKRTKRELHILNSLICNQPPCHVILDVPCGGGRLSEPMSNKTKYLIEADSSPAQVKLALDSNQNLVNRRGCVVSAMLMPLKDNSVDAVMCIRLSHHFPDAEERKHLLKEMLRVSKRFLVFSYTDFWSTQTFFRAIIGGKKINPATMRSSEISDIAKRHGGKLKKTMTVFQLGSRHRFALIIKERLN